MSKSYNVIRQREITELLFRLNAIASRIEVRFPSLIGKEKTISSCMIDSRMGKQQNYTSYIAARAMESLMITDSIS